MLRDEGEVGVGGVVEDRGGEEAARGGDESRRGSVGWLGGDEPVLEDALEGGDFDFDFE